MNYEAPYLCLMTLKTPICAPEELGRLKSRQTPRPTPETPALKDQATSGFRD